MATTFNLYDQWRDFIADPARAAAVSGTLKVALFLTGMPVDQNLHDFYDDLVPGTNEVSGGSYTARGNACASPTWTGPDGAGLLTFDATDPAQWAQDAGGFTAARRAVLYYDTATDSTSRLVGYSNDFGADVSNVSGTVDVAFNASGIYTAPR